MTDAVFDTTVLIDSYNRRQSAVDLFNAVANREIDAAYSPITAFELWAQVMGRDEELYHLASLSIVREIAFTTDLAMQVGQWLRPANRSQRLRLASDAMIAATAASLGATIYTRNPRDFARFYTDVQSY